MLTGALHHFAIRKALGAEARVRALRALGAAIGADVFIGARVTVRIPANLTVGDRTTLSGTVWIDSWHPVVFGRDILVNDDLTVLTAAHDLNSATFAPTGAPVTVGDYAWLPQKIIVLPGANIGEGAVVATGSVVTRPVAPYTVVAGNPARKISDRVRRPYSYR
jgi:maltose O-acetyltransferase